jgi:hypothetical protein
VNDQPDAPEPYTLVVTAWNGGFFSHVNRVVNHLCHSLGRDGCRAVRVDWRVSEHTPLFAYYGTPEDGELWQRFFEPLRFPDAPSAERSSYQYADLSMTGLYAYRMYKRGSRWRSDYGHAYAEHVRVRDELRRRVDRLWSDGTVAGKAVGVHYRHSEHDHENPRASASIDAYISRARRVLAQTGANSIVLATDVHEALDSFRAEFGERLLVQPDAARAPAAGSQYERSAPPGIALGEQILIDALLLARCDVLLHATSNIATAVGYMNPAMRMVYVEPRLRGAVETLRARVTPQRHATPEGVWRSLGS